MYILLQTGRQKKCIYEYQYVMTIFTLVDKFKQSRAAFILYALYSTHALDEHYSFHNTDIVTLHQYDT